MPTMSSSLTNQRHRGSAGYSLCARLQPLNLVRFDEDLLLLIRCHAAAFEALGGAPRDVLDGPMDTAVIGEGEIGGFIADGPSPKTTANGVLTMNYSREARFHPSAAV